MKIWRTEWEKGWSLHVIVDFKDSKIRQEAAWNLLDRLGIEGGNNLYEDERVNIFEGEEKCIGFWATKTYRK